MSVRVMMAVRFVMPMVAIVIVRRHAPAPVRDTS